MSTIEIRIDDHAPDSDLEFLEQQIYRFNMQRVDAYDVRRLAAFVRHDGAIIAGISGYTWAGMCEIQFLWVHGDLRGQGYGSKLLAAAEQEALTRGCSTVALNTHSFQAPEFYRRHGYLVAGSVPDCPPGHSHLYLYKQLTPT